MSTLVEFKKASGHDFENIFSLLSNFEQSYESVLMLMILALRKGYELESPSIFKKIWNLIRYGTTLGIKNSQYIRILDENYALILEFIPEFFLMLTTTDKKK